MRKGNLINSFSGKVVINLIVCSLLLFLIFYVFFVKLGGVDVCIVIFGSFLIVLLIENLVGDEGDERGGDLECIFYFERFMGFDV